MFCIPAFFAAGQKLLSEKEKEPRSHGKIISYRCCLPSSNVSVKKDFDKDVLFNQCSNTFLATFCNAERILTKCKQTPCLILIDKAIFGENGRSLCNLEGQS